MKFTTLLATLCVLLTSVTCSAARRDEQLTPLSASQKKELQQATLSLAAALASVSGSLVDVHDRPRIWFGEMFWFAELTKRKINSNWLGLSDDPYALLVERLRKGLADGSCDKAIPPPLEFAGGGLPKFWGAKDLDLVVAFSGARCPMTYREVTKLRVNEETLLGNQTRQYVIQAEDLVKAVGVKELQFEQSADFRLGKDLTVDPSKGTHRLEGTVTYVEHGKCKFYVEMDGEATYETAAGEAHKTAKGEVRVGIELPGYTGQLRVTGKKIIVPQGSHDSETESHHYLNNEEISDSVWGAYFRI